MLLEETEAGAVNRLGTLLVVSPSERVCEGESAGARELDKATGVQAYFGETSSPC